MYNAWWGYSFGGMFWLWWLFWVAAVFMVFGYAQPVPRRTLRQFREQTPLATLQRRYAAGEISTEQYEERRAILERDRLVADDSSGRLQGTDRLVPRPQ